MEGSSAIAAEQSAKRARSPSGDIPLPAAKVAKTHGSPLQINYLSKQLPDNLPLVGAEDTLPNILRLIGEYDGVLQRHESIAGNLGACPLGPILLKRFERLFDGPPRILKHHGKDVSVTWLDVVEFARNKPEQFNLEKMRNGVRVCQFYTKQSRVEISEEDHVLIASGMPQKLIPPQPIFEDEEKELGVIEVLEKNLGQILQLADQVSARARQLNHKLRSRRSAILSRRELESDGKKVEDRSHSPMEDVNGTGGRRVSSVEASMSPPSGFMAVNVRHTAPVEPEQVAVWSSIDSLSNTPHTLFDRAETANVTIINGKSIKDASPTVRAEMMKQFFSGSEYDHRLRDEPRRQSSGAHRPTHTGGPPTRSKPRSSSIEMAGIGYMKSSPTVAIPNTPASLLPQAKPPTSDGDDGGPYKAEMIRRMEPMRRGDRVVPPCDRCRRLHMDCIKNLTACMGCTRKHARCCWKDVKPEELLPMGSNVVEQGSENAIRAGSGPDILPEMMEDVETEAANAELSDPSHMPISPTQAVSSEPVDPKPSPAKFDVRPPPIKPPFRDANKNRQSAQYSAHSLSSLVRQSVEGDEGDEGDRLQALAAQVYRSASQSVRPWEG